MEWQAESAREVTPHPVLVHVIADLTRHAGHADIVRELLDGAVGMTKGNDNMPPADRSWWESYHAKLERVAREADGA